MWSAGTKYLDSPEPWSTGSTDPMSERPCSSQSEYPVPRNAWLLDPNPTARGTPLFSRKNGNGEESARRILLYEWMPPLYPRPSVVGRSEARFGGGRVDGIGV